METIRRARKPFFNLIGRRSGRLTVIAPSSKRTGGNVHWSCRCSCGNLVEVAYNNIKNKIARSCGCLRRELVSKKNFRHGMAGTLAHKIWIGMRDRCVNPNSKNFDRYGGRGIKVCRRWNSFTNFLKDMGDPPAGRSIERINNEKGYSPSNCRWATRPEQMRNYSRNIIFRFNGISKCVADWADQFKVNRYTVYKRIGRGMSVRLALGL